MSLPTVKMKEKVPADKIEEKVPTKRMEELILTNSMDEKVQADKMEEILNRRGMKRNYNLERRIAHKLCGAGARAGTPSVPCLHCDKKFMRGYNMRVHIERVHKKNKPWRCQFCEKTFATTSDLKQHLSSHGMGKIHKVFIFYLHYKAI